METNINRRQYKEPHPIIKNSKDYVYVIIGAAIIAIAFNVFLLPNQVASGGVSGISTILKGVFGWAPGLVQYAFNIPLFIAGLIFLGAKFGIKSFVGTLVLPAVVLLTAAWEPWTMNPLLGCIVWWNYCWFRFGYRF